MMTAREWINKMGWDVSLLDDSDHAEVMKISGGRLKVHSKTRFAIVASTADPVTAVLLTDQRGLIRSELEAMNPDIADALVYQNIL